ncbi:4522_t:CDS:1 [Funneliformis mosseae]|uniref:Phosphatidylglycerol/phosphatidylinositol transfer protein n=1 Tax=Funneliformis mosseae TaxID=27381 RepID=A0A9N9EBM9_FUNMO|nr:4522_t:CDS:1 [Funneliformis mosseae]
MNRKFIFALILMVVFSTANATTEFRQCMYGVLAKPLPSVTINPDPVDPGKLVTFNVSGTIPTKITEHTAIQAYYYDLKNGEYIDDKYIESICTGTGCSIEANAPYTKIFKFLAPPNLPSRYLIEVNVREKSGGEILACACTVQFYPPR